MRGHAWTLCAGAVLGGVVALAAVRGLAEDAPAPMTEAELEAFAALTPGEVEAMGEEAFGRLMERAAAAQEAGGENDFMDLTMPDLGEPRAARPGADACAPQPEPAWYEELNTDRRLLVRELYEARSYEAIIAAGDCPCELRKPSWAAVEAEYQADYAAANADVVDEADAEFRRLAARLRRDARAVCEPQGTW